MSWCPSAPVPLSSLEEFTDHKSRPLRPPEGARRAPTVGPSPLAQVTGAWQGEEVGLERVAAVCFPKLGKAPR